MHGSQVRTQNFVTGVQMSKILNPSPTQLGGLVWGRTVSSPVGSGAEPQQLLILVHFGLNRKRLVARVLLHTGACANAALLTYLLVILI